MNDLCPTTETSNKIAAGSDQIDVDLFLQRDKVTTRMSNQNSKRSLQQALAKNYSKVSLYPSGDNLPDQIQVAIDMARQVSLKTMTIQNEVE